MDTETTLTGQYFAARVETSNYARGDEPARMSVTFDGDRGTDLIHIHVGPLSMAFHVPDWQIIVAAVNTAIGEDAHQYQAAAL